jgi:hypothetical protein
VCYLILSFRKKQILKSYSDSSSAANGLFPFPNDIIYFCFVSQYFTSFVELNAIKNRVPMDIPLASNT